MSFDRPCVFEVGNKGLVLAICCRGWRTDGEGGAFDRDGRHDLLGVCSGNRGDKYGCWRHNERGFARMSVCASARVWFVARLELFVDVGLGERRKLRLRV